MHYNDYSSDEHSCILAVVDSLLECIPRGVVEFELVSVELGFGFVRVLQYHYITSFISGKT